MGELIQKTSPLVCGLCEGSTGIIQKNKPMLFSYVYFCLDHFSLVALFGHVVSFSKEFSDLWLIIHALV